MELGSFSFLSPASLPSAPQLLDLRFLLLLLAAVAVVVVVVVAMVVAVVVAVVVLCFHRCR